MNHSVGPSSLSKVEEAAIAAAVAVRNCAYAPYSRFTVGAVLIDSSGGMHVGCNVENASYGLTQCAERSAVTAATAAGRRDIVCCVLVADTDEPITPCGACRQVLAEVSTTMEVLCCTMSGTYRRYTMDQLLPSGFTAADLD
jgi:cytidine deaminase